MIVKLALRFTALTYLTLLLIGPVGMVFYRTFEKGFGPAWASVTTPEAIHAFWVTILLVLIAVPLNTVFGVICAIVLTRHTFRGKAVLNSLIDLPFAISPVIIGLALILVYHPTDGWFGGWLMNNGIQVLFSLPGMALATIFVTLPFVVREVVPVLKEIGDEQEQAASTLGANSWQTFWNITLPSIRWGLSYGVILATARALGEFGAVTIVSGKLQGETETMTLFVEQRFHQFDLQGTYAASIVLALLAIFTLLLMNLGNKKIDKD